MQLVVAKNIGFCFGVNRAVAIAEDEKKKTASAIYTLGHIIHNSAVVEKLRSQGIIPVDSVSELNKGDTLIIRSHGASNEVFVECERLGINVVDATCPFVKRIHEIVEQAAQDGLAVIIAGKETHPEVVGIKLRAGENVHVVSNSFEAESIFAENACLVSQTTFNSDAFDAIAGVLTKNCGKLQVHNTICDTTRNRQIETDELSRKCSAMVVIGGKGSSNTQKLLNICKKNCKNIQSIENTCELTLEYIKNDDIIGVVAGASTPEWIIREVITRMNELEKTAVSNTEEAAVTEQTTEKVVSNDTAESNSNPATDVLPVSADDIGDQSFAEALDSTMRRITAGQRVTGKVISVSADEICVNIGYKSDGIITRSEYTSDPAVVLTEVVKPGDLIETEVLKVNDGEGNVQLSRKHIENKLKMEAMLDDEDIKSKVFKARCKEAVKGGIVAEINGMRAFIPASLVSVKFVEDLSVYNNKTIDVKVIEVDKQRKRMVVSAKAVMLEQVEGEKRKIREQLEVGSKVNGVVKRLTKFGAFVDIGGVEGLLHVTDMAWGRVKQPSDILHANQEIEVLILGVDLEKDHISLGYKQLQPKPWSVAEERYPVGSIVTGTVVRIVPFGAFVELEPTVDGLIHISQVSVRHIGKVEDEINVGDEVRCKVLDVNAGDRRISLSRREVILDENPEIAEELAREREEREKERAERAAQKAEQQDRSREVRHAAPAANHTQREDNASREDRQPRERRPRREDGDYQLPPVESATTSLAALFSGYATEEPAAESEKPAKKTKAKKTADEQEAE